MACCQFGQRWRDVRSTRLLLLTALCIAFPASGEAQYRITDLDPDFPSKHDALHGCAATGINDDGFIVGGCDDTYPNESFRGFSYDGRHFREIDFRRVKGTGELDTSIYQTSLLKKDHRQKKPVIDAITPQDVNIHGDVTGWYLGSGGLQGFLKTRHTTYTIAVPNSSLTEATGINDAGQVVGDYRGADGLFHAFLLTDGVFETFGNDVGASDINNLGHIVGCYSLCSRGFLYSGGAFTSIDVPGAIVTQARSINDRGQIVGVYSSDGETVRGFAYDGVTFTSIDVTGAVVTDVFRINNLGEIVGFYVSEPSPGVFEHHAFVAEP
jgi:probable HAF family extracellular repeat protein